MGLRHEELKGMIVPFISIDEFEPKMGTVEEIIVVTFFSKDELPAYDLDDFIDKSVIDLLDSEVSPNPNENGYYLVFVEFKRRPNFWMHLYNLVKDIENVTGKQEWKVQPYLVDELYDLHDKALHEVVITKQESYVPKSEYSSTVEDYVSDSNLLEFKRDDTHLKFGGREGNIVLEYVDFDDVDSIVKKLNLQESHIDLNTSATRTALRRMLGENWDVTTIDSYHFITKSGSEKTLAVRGS